MQRLLTGDVSGRVRDALGEGAPGAGTDQYLVLGIKYWQNSFKYNSFSFHAVSMDLGACVQTWRMWAAARGLAVEPSGSTRSGSPNCWASTRHRRGSSPWSPSSGPVRARVRREAREPPPPCPCGAPTPSGRGPSSPSTRCSRCRRPPRPGPPPGPPPTPWARPPRTPPTSGCRRPPCRRPGRWTPTCAPRSAPAAAASAASTRRGRSPQTSWPPAWPPRRPDRGSAATPVTYGWRGCTPSSTTSRASSPARTPTTPNGAPCGG